MASSIAWLSVVLFFALSSAVLRAEDAPAPKVGAALAEEIVEPSEGVTEFKVAGRRTLFRLRITVVAGGTVLDPKITGKAMLVRSARVVRLGEGGDPLIGVDEREFVFRGTAAGLVTIEITTKSPTQPMPITEQYSVTIE
jgi:hypothetical protein